MATKSSTANFPTSVMSTPSYLQKTDESDPANYYLWEASDITRFQAEIVATQQRLIDLGLDTLDVSAAATKLVYVNASNEIDVTDTIVISGTTATVGAGKTLDVSAGTLTLADDQISGDKVEGGTIAAITINSLTCGTTADFTGATVTITAGSVAEAALANYAADGLNARRMARATFDASAGKAIGTYSLGVNLPDNAIVTRAWYEVSATFTSATDAATISLGINTDDAAGIVAAIAISDASNPWDAGNHDAIQDGTAANFSTKTTAARALEAVVAVEDLTAGVLTLFVEYIIGA